MISAIDKQSLNDILFVQIINFCHFPSYVPYKWRVVQSKKQKQDTLHASHSAFPFMKVYYVEPGNLRTLVSFSGFEGDSVGVDQSRRQV